MYPSSLLAWAVAFFAVQAFSQPLISCGQSADVDFVGGFAFTDTTLSTDPQFQSMRFGTSFRYDIPLAPGLYAVELRFIEPNKTAAKQRLFQVTMAGQQTPVLDLFALAGRSPYVLRTVALAGAGLLTIQFQGLLGNAVVSTIQVRAARQDDVYVGLAFADFLTGQLAAAPVAGVAISWETCKVPACAGQDRIVVVGFGGQHVQYVGQPSAAVYDATQWAVKFQ